MYPRYREEIAAFWATCVLRVAGIVIPNRGVRFSVRIPDHELSLGYFHSQLCVLEIGR